MGITSHVQDISTSPWLGTKWRVTSCRDAASVGPQSDRVGSVVLLPLLSGCLSSSTHVVLEQGPEIICDHLWSCSSSRCECVREINTHSTKDNQEDADYSRRGHFKIQRKSYCIHICFVWMSFYLSLNDKRSTRTLKRRNAPNLNEANPLHGEECTRSGEHLRILTLLHPADAEVHIDLR